MTSFAAQRASEQEPSAPRVALPTAVLGNGSLLITLSSTGRVERLWWPHVDWAQHLGELRLGVAWDGRTVWLDGEELDHQQAYLDDAFAVRTIARAARFGVELTDFVAAEQDVLVRELRSTTGGLSAVAYCRPNLGERERYGAAYVDSARGAAVFYCREFALAVSLGPAGKAACGRAVPGSASPLYTDALRAELDGGGTAHGVVEAALVAPFDGEARLLVALGETPEEALQRLDEVGDGPDLLDGRRAYDRELVAAARPPLAITDGIEPLYRRSLQVVDVLTDRDTGAMIAAPELDPDFVYSGGYGFVWARDLAYGVLASLACGRGRQAAASLRWLARNQSPDGFWAQRHWTDGRVAPSWCRHQLDETGTALYVFELAWRELRDEELDRELWPAARRAADFLVSWREGGSGLPQPTHDLWEEREGIHAYTLAATIAGLRAASALAQRHDPERAPAYAHAAAAMRDALEQELWSDAAGRYLRTPGDEIVDVSLLGLAWPFRAVDPGCARMRATVAAITNALRLEDGGLLRYEGDTYAGGNAWILAALWLGLWHRQVGEGDGHRRGVEYAIARTTELGLLPEQVGPDGSPTWVLPLAWSHALLLVSARPELAAL